MKREKFLWPLTQSHHRALMTAKRVKEMLSGPGGDEDGNLAREMAAEVRGLYEDELRTHFWDEEKMLGLYEAHMGRFEPEPEKIRREHRLLESFMAQADSKSLLEFAELLTSHVRFEEDVLFGKIERALDEAEKQAVGALLKAAPAIQACAKER